MTASTTELLHESLNHLEIELPSWGFADTGTRFGKFLQDAAAISFEDKLADAGHVNRLTGICPQIAVHVLWDFEEGRDPREAASQAKAHGIRIGSINPNLFQDQGYKFGSLCHPDPGIRERASSHVRESIAIAKAVGSRSIALWLADGTNYPGQDSIRARKQRLHESLRTVYGDLGADQAFLVEYKPFEPAFYHTDLADWGMSYVHAKKLGPQAKVLVDTGHHYQGQNIEQIVAFLLDEGMLGGFHFNDRRYADDDLTLGSIDPYQVFRIFHEIHAYAAEQGGKYPTVDYMIDQSHNLKPKIEAMIQTVSRAQELWAKAALVDHEALRRLQDSGELVDAEGLLQDAFATDVRPALREWRESRGLPPDPLLAHRQSGYHETISAERRQRRLELGIGGASSYA